jgi:hypothetical protein
VEVAVQQVLAVQQMEAVVALEDIYQAQHPLIQLCHTQ